jgi:hypothetical protein
MRKNDNSCANCGGKFGLVSYQHWGLCFCRRACKSTFLARSARDRARVRKWFGFLGRGTSCAAEVPARELALLQRTVDQVRQTRGR